MITLEAFNTDPFSVHSQLKTIWPEPSNTNMQEGYSIDIKNIHDYPHLDWGMMFLIKKENSVIGITGVFLESDDGYVRPINPKQETVYLRWHGVVHEERRQGYSEEALNLLLVEVQKRYPNIKTLIELIPQTHYSRAIEEHFKQLGFKAIGQEEKYDWSEYMWQPYHLDIPQYLNQLGLNQTISKHKKMNI